MIYELAILAKTGLNETESNAINEIVSQSCKEFESDILLSDEWGRVVLAQASSKGEKEGYYYYFILKANGDCNNEIQRRLKINENVMRQFIFKLGEDEDAAKLMKSYKTPFSKKYEGSSTDELEESDLKSPGGKSRKFSRSKSCWFTSKGIDPNWKDPGTYRWLLDEFGKISPARVSGISRKYQRFVNTEIKRARNLGIISYISGKVAYKAN